MTDEDFEDKDSDEKFDQLMTFLKKAKRRVEKKKSSLNQTSAGAAPGTKSVVNVITSSVSLPASQLPNQTGPSQSQKPKKKESK